MSDRNYNGAVHDGQHDAPVIFAFHGTGGNEYQFFDLARQLVPGASVIAPRGDVSEGGAARYFRRTGEGVYDMDDLARQTQRMADFIAAHRDLRPGRPVYGFGYSNGANILASVMMARPDLFDRAGLLHPLIPWQPAPVPGLSGVAVLITAGQRDPICPWPVTQRLIDWLDGQGARLQTSIHAGGHELRPQEITALAALFTEPAEGGET
jgi:phospholipase/carboxylesterase